jgi:hypothetical protein
MSKYGPSRGEHLFRAALSLAGLALLAAGLTVNGIPSGPAVFEILIFCGGFFGGSLFWSLWKLWTGRAS